MSDIGTNYVGFIVTALVVRKVSFVFGGKRISFRKVQQLIK